MRDYRGERKEPVCYNQIFQTAIGEISLLKCKQECRFVSLKYRVIFTPEGMAEIIFDTSLFYEFTIIVNNISASNIQGYLKGYPELNNYGMIDSPTLQTIEPNSQEIFVGKVVINYTGIALTGVPGSQAVVYLQAQYLE